MPTRSWTDDDLRTAIAAAHSWRGVGRLLNLKSTSVTRGLRERANQLGISYAHFTGQRRWLDAELKSAVAASFTWADVARALGYATVNGGALATIRVHARRLNIDSSHLKEPARPEVDEVIRTSTTQVANIRKASAGIAMAWCALRGWVTSLPAEGCVYDLVVDLGTGSLKRVQIKTATYKGHYGEWSGDIYRPHRPGGQKVYYTPDEIDLFFIIDGDMSLYLIPIEAVIGQMSINPRAYAAYRVGSAASLLQSSELRDVAKSG